MAYSRSPATLHKIYKLLQRLEKGEPVAWAVEPGKEHKFAYKVREALHIARQHPTLYPRLTNVADTFEIRVSNGRVLADVKADVDSLEAIAAVDESGGNLTMTSGTMEMRGAQTPESVIATWNQHRPEKLHFPDAQLGALQLKEVWRWISQNELLMFAHESSLTITRDDPDLREFAWAPTEENL